MPDRIVEDWGLAVAPVYVLFGNESLKDEGEQSVAEFYRRLAAADELPTTSQPTPADIAAIYRRLAEEGATDIISIHVTARSSGTCSSAELAKGMLADEDVNIHVVDSESTSLHMAFMLCEAMAVVEAGGNAADALAAIEQVKAHSNMFFTVTRVEHLERSGRTHGAERAVMPVIRRLQRENSYAHIGAMPLLGVNGITLIGHGWSRAPAIVGAIGQAKQAVEAHLVDALQTAVNAVVGV